MHSPSWKANTIHIEQLVHRKTWIGRRSSRESCIVCKTRTFSRQHPDRYVCWRCPVTDRVKSKLIEWRYRPQTTSAQIDPIFDGMLSHTRRIVWRSSAWNNTCQSSLLHPYHCAKILRLYICLNIVASHTVTYMVGARTVVCVIAYMDVDTTLHMDTFYYLVDRMTLHHTIVPTSLFVDGVANFDTKAERYWKTKDYNELT